MVYHLDESDIDKAAQVFVNSPGMQFVFPDDQYRKNNTIQVYAFLIRSAMRNGWVTAPSKKIEGLLSGLILPLRAAFFWTVLTRSTLILLSSCLFRQPEQARTIGWGLAKNPTIVKGQSQAL